MTASWLGAFVDLAPEAFDGGAAFWSAVTGFVLSEPRGAHGEFATLLPPDGDDYLKVQRLGTGPSRIHLDVSVPDPRAAADAAVTRGAVEVADRGYVVLRSPGGLPFCFVSHGGSVRPTPVVWPAGHRSMVYQVCVDLPASAYDDEAAFWAAVLDAEPELLVSRPEFTWLRPSAAISGHWALDVLLQRLDRADGPVAAHLDLGTTDRPAEVARHVALGAEEVTREEFWTVLRDPAGLAYCVTDRDPATGRLAPPPL